MGFGKIVLEIFCGIFQWCSDHVFLVAFSEYVGWFANIVEPGSYSRIRQILKTGLCLILCYLLMGN